MYLRNLEFSKMATSGKKQEEGIRWENFTSIDSRYPDASNRLKMVNIQGSKLKI